MSQPSGVEKKEPLTIENKDSKQQFSSKFCSKHDGYRTMKRLRDDSTSQGTGGTEENEPEEKRRSFRLNPPTLIHGQAKPAPKEDEESGDTLQKRNFLRPSILSAPSTAVAVSTTSSVNGKSNSVTSQPTMLGTGLPISTQVPLNNPFLKAAGTDTLENEDNKQELLFQTTIEQKVKENGKVEVTSKDEVSTSSLDNVNGSEENVFLQMSKGSSAVSEKSVTESTGFVFGSKMEERVVKNEADSTSENSEEVKNSSTQFVFGSNLSDRIKNASDAANVVFSTTADVSDGVSSSSSNRNLEEDAAAMFAASNTKPVIPEVEVLTGEEDEKNVLQIQCKLFHYNAVTQCWNEKGRGNLRLNDKRVSTSDQVFQSRLVMRTHGSLRLILNTKVWAAMIVDKASSKSVRISAQNEDGDIGVYLIMAAMNDAEQIHRALEYRVLHLKQVEERLKEMQETESNRQECDQSSCPVEESDNLNQEKLESVQEVGDVEKGAKSSTGLKTDDSNAKTNVSEAPVSNESPQDSSDPIDEKTCEISTTSKPQKENDDN